MKTWEVELKFQITAEDWNEIRGFLPVQEPESITYEEDLYFDINNGKNFAIQDKALRLRKTKLKNNTNEQVDYKTELAFKGPKIRTESKSRIEYNVVCSDYEAMKNILAELGFFPVMYVRKERIAYKFTLESYEVLLTKDSVENLGLFVELEVITTNESNIDYIEQVLKYFWHNLIDKTSFKSESAKKSIRESYLGLLIQKFNAHESKLISMDAEADA